MGRVSEALQLGFHDAYPIEKFLLGQEADISAASNNL
jgi:hypothetical protein